MYSLIENKQKRGRSWPIKNADGWIRTGVHRCWKQLAVFQFPINLPQSLFSISLFAPLSFYCTFVCLSVRSFYLFKHVPIPPSFCLVSSFPHHNSTINWKSVEVVDGDRTRGRRMVGTDRSTELWQTWIDFHPWSSGYRRRLMFWRSLVRIPVLYTGWTFFHTYLL